MNKERFESLDGLRGIAAMIVVYCHFLSAYSPVVPQWFEFSPLALSYNGSFSVAIFFVLSGFVIANSAAKSAMPVLFNVLQRYIRLALPALAGVLFGWELFKLLPHEVAALKLVHSNAWMIDAAWDNNVPNLFHAFKHGLLDIFIHAKSKYNGVLWTMKIELIGSVGLYILYGVVPERYRTKILIATALLLATIAKRPEYATFAIGAFMREKRVIGKLPVAYAWPALVVGLLIGSMMEGCGKILHVPHQIPAFMVPGKPQGFWQTVAAAALVYAVLALPKVSNFLSSRPVKFLGEISFGVYLVHFPLLFTVFVPAYLLVQHSFIGMSLLLAVFFSVSIALGYGFTYVIDKPVMQLIQSAKKAYLGMKERRFASKSFST